MNRKRWALLLKKDDTVDVYYITEAGKYQRRAELTHRYVSSPEKVVEVISEQTAAKVWIDAITSALRTVLRKQQTERGVVFGIIDEYGAFFELDMATIVYMVRPMIEHAFVLLVEERANVA